MIFLHYLGIDSTILFLKSVKPKLDSLNISDQSTS